MRDVTDCRRFVPIIVVGLGCLSATVAIGQSVTAEQHCDVVASSGSTAKTIKCQITLVASDIGENQKLSLQYHLRPGYDVSLPATIPDAPKAGVSFQSDEPWKCVSQGAPAAPAHGCFLTGKDLNAAGGSSTFRSEVTVLNAQHTRDIQSCFRVVASNSTRELHCLVVPLGMPDAVLKIGQNCAPTWSDGSFINLDCSIQVTGEHVLPGTYIRVLNQVLVGDIVVDAKVLKTVSQQAWVCDEIECTLDSETFVAAGQSSALQIKSRVGVPHVDEELNHCVQATTRTPKLAADRSCLNLGRAELVR